MVAFAPISKIQWNNPSFSDFDPPNSSTLEDRIVFLKNQVYSGVNLEEISARCKSVDKVEMVE